MKNNQKIERKIGRAARLFLVGTFISLLFSPVRGDDRMGKRPAPQGIALYDTLVAKLNSAPKDALSLAFRILELPKAEKPDTIEAFTTVQIGVILDKSGYPMQALNFYLDGVTMLEQIGYKAKSGYLYIDIGNLYFRQQQYETAENYYQTAADLFKVDKFWAGYYTATNNLALVAKAKGNFETARDSFSAALHIPQEKMDFPYFYAHSYQYLGDLYHAWGKKDSAIHYYIKCLSIDISDHQKTLTGLIYQKAAAVLLELGDTLWAEDYLIKAEREFLKRENIYSLAEIYQTMIRLYFNKNMDDKALETLQIAQKLAKDKGLLEQRIRLQKTYLHYLKSFGSRGTELLFAQQDSLISLMESRYRQETQALMERRDILSIVREFQHKAAISELEMKNLRNWRNGAFVAGIILAGLLAMTLLRYWQNKRMHKEIFAQQSEIHRQELEIEALQRQQTSRELLCMTAMMQQQASDMGNVLQILHEEKEKQSKKDSLNID
ncbi:MAG TPA: tetratricopeptide repeat protein, partial [Candidatus Marinimicrobia bacterium]|nr:tetratricopeptide repeat protein [Candidatus Neomarinimicrobiota bacterium]